MDHFTRAPVGSIVDRLMAMAPVPPERAGIDEARATLLGPAGDITGAVEHVWLREPTETERDFVAMALAAARDLGATTLGLKVGCACRHDAAPYVRATPPLPQIPPGTVSRASGRCNRPSGLLQLAVPLSHSQSGRATDARNPHRLVAEQLAAPDKQAAQQVNKNIS
jgi:hypothetical protein